MNATLGWGTTHGNAINLFTKQKPKHQHQNVESSDNEQHYPRLRIPPCPAAAPSLRLPPSVTLYRN